VAGVAQPRAGRREGRLQSQLASWAFLAPIAVVLLALAFAAPSAHVVALDQVEGSWFLPVLFILMGSKFAIVVLWYMHLKFDDRRYARFFIMGLAGAATLYLIVLISFNVFADR